MARARLKSNRGMGSVAEILKPVTSQVLVTYRVAGFGNFATVELLRLRPFDEYMFYG